MGLFPSVQCQSNDEVRRVFFIALPPWVLYGYCTGNSYWIGTFNLINRCRFNDLSSRRTTEKVGKQKYGLKIIYFFCPKIKPNKTSINTIQTAANTPIITKPLLQSTNGNISDLISLCFKALRYGMDWDGNMINISLLIEKAHKLLQGRRTDVIWSLSPRLLKALKPSSYVY